MSFNPKFDYKHDPSFKDKQGVTKKDEKHKKATVPSLDRNREKPSAKYDPHSSEYDKETAKTKDHANCFHKFKQGVSTKGAKPAGLRVLPTFSSGLNYNFVDVLNYGQPENFKKNEAFEDIASLTNTEIKADKTVSSAVIDYIDSSDKQTYALDLISKAYDDPNQLDGVIEPFAVREVISNTSIESPYNARSVKGSLQDGNMNTLRRSSKIQSLYPLTSSANISAFLDTSDAMGDIILEGPVWSDEKNIIAFDDTQHNNNNVNQRELLLSASADMINAIRSLSPAQEQYPPAGFKSSRTGFIFTNRAFGTDSVAFGDLLNDA